MSSLHNALLLQVYTGVKREYAKAEEVLSCVVRFVRKSFNCMSDTFVR